MAGEGGVSERIAQEWALAYAGLGWRVFPVVAGGKRPAFAGWQRGATTDPNLIARYWRGEPGPNIGLITGETFIAFDIEAAHLPALRTWMETADHAVPETPIARTGRGGIHILARAHEQQSGRVLRLGSVHIGELKAQGGFIVACPSRTTGSYGWHRSPDEVTVADAPDWLRGLAVEPRSRVSANATPLGPSRAVALVAGLYRVVAGAPEGERNAILFWASCRVAEHGVDTDAAGDVLLAAAITAGLSEREARHTIASGLRR